MSFFLKNKFLALGLILVIAGGALLLLSRLARENTPAQVVEKAAFTYEIVATPEKQKLGLSGRSVIPDNYGMLFVFTEKQLHGFWMKEMLAPIDIIWLSDEGTILGIEHSVIPETYPTSFYPPELVRLVLETRAGYAKDKGWDVGTKIDLPQI